MCEKVEGLHSGVQNQLSPQSSDLGSDLDLRVKQSGRQTISFLSGPRILDLAYQLPVL